MSSIKEALAYAVETIEKIAQNPQKEARILLSFHIKKDLNYIFLHENDELKDIESFKKLCKRRAEGEPIEYILKKVSFYSEEFYIDKGALIPRPETEILIDNVLKVQKYIKHRPVKIAEIGVGSGIISVMLAKLIKDAKIVATDISEDALKIAEKNIEKFDLKERIGLKKCSYLDEVKENIDILVSNPPYVADGFKVEKPLEYEPKEAIFGGERGDEILQNIISIALEKNVSYLICEMGYDQKESIKKRFDKEKLSRYRFYKDLANLDRGFVLEL